MSEKKTTKQKPKETGSGGLLVEAVPEAAFFKGGIYGPAGGGKSFTAAKIAIGLYHYLKSEAPVAFIDTETGSDFLLPMFKEANVKLVRTKSTSFSDLLKVVDEAEASCSVLIIDSITHFWNEVMESYKKKHNISFISLKHWIPLKQEWREFTSKYVNSKLHIIMCGRAADKWEDVMDEDGVKELKKVGTKMKAEVEVGHEPSLLVEIIQVNKGPQAGAGWIHRAFVIKDRFDIIDGHIFDNPTFVDFLPHIESLNLGGEHKGFETSEDTQDLFEDAKTGALWHKTHEIVLDEIKAEMSYLHPGTKDEAKKAKMDLSQKLFNTKSWDRVKTRSNEELKEGRDKIKAMNEERTKKEVKK